MVVCVVFVIGAFVYGRIVGKRAAFVRIMEIMKGTWTESMMNERYDARLEMLKRRG
jgi:hypothetical protein